MVEMKNDNQKFEEYARFLCGENDLAETRLMWERLGDDPEEKRKLEKLSRFWFHYHPKINSADQVWKKTAQKLAFNTSGIRMQWLQAAWVKYAAAILLIVSLGANVVSLIHGRQTESSGIKEYRTNVGEIKEFQLADGTHIWLNAKSHLLVPETFNGKTRDVFLSGEAYFNVAKNSKRPFIVNTSAYKVRVLGTSFNVKNYPEEKLVTTHLVEGKVELLSQTNLKQILTLTPSEEAVFDQSNSTIRVNRKTKESAALWRQGRFWFYNEEFSSIARQLERKFNCEFVFIDDKAEKLRFTADFPTEDVDSILSLLNEAHNFEYKKIGAKYLISYSQNKKDQTLVN